MDGFYASVASEKCLLSWWLTVNTKKIEVAVIRTDSSTRYAIIIIIIIVIIIICIGTWYYYKLNYCVGPLLYSFWGLLGLNKLIVGIMCFELDQSDPMARTKLPFLHIFYRFNLIPFTRKVVVILSENMSGRVFLI